MLKNFDVVKLYFPNGIQLSNGKGDQVHNFDYLHSDTLKAALFYNAVQLFGNSESHKYLQWFQNISSAFPFYNNTLFFPKPFVKLPFEFETQDTLSVSNKKLKNIRFVDRLAFEKILFNVKTSIKEKQLLNSGKFLSFEQQADVRIYFKNATQKVYIEQYQSEGSYTRESTPYSVEYIHFTPQAGLYFIAEKGIINEAFVWVLKLLGENGIGGDKNNGYGIFNYEIITDGLQLNLPDNPKGFINLSLYCPTKDEINEITNHEASYELIKRGGYIANPNDMNLFSKRKKSIYMFSEGSAFFTPNKLKGKQVNTAPHNSTHAIWRCGNSIFIPFVN